jgi:large subunit ribosomal protein L28
MSRRCELTGKGVSFGRNVSHSKRRTPRTYLPNLKKVSLQSEALGRTVPLKIAVATLRTVQHRGGLDAFLLSEPEARLTPEALRLRRSVLKARRV